MLLALQLIGQHVAAHQRVDRVDAGVGHGPMDRLGPHLPQAEGGRRLHRDLTGAYDADGSHQPLLTGSNGPLQPNGFVSRRELTFGRGEAHLPSRQDTGTVWRAVPGCLAPTSPWAMSFRVGSIRSQITP